MATNRRQESPYSRAFAEQIKAERVALDLPVAAMARRAGLNRMTYTRIEDHEIVADVTQVSHIAEALGLSLTDLWARAEARAAENAKATS